MVQQTIQQKSTNNLAYNRQQRYAAIISSYPCPPLLLQKTTITASFQSSRTLLLLQASRNNKGSRCRRLSPLCLKISAHIPFLPDDFPLLRFLTALSTSSNVGSCARNSLPGFSGIDRISSSSIFRHIFGLLLNKLSCK